MCVPVIIRQHCLIGERAVWVGPAPTATVAAHDTLTLIASNRDGVLPGVPAVVQGVRHTAILERRPAMTPTPWGSLVPTQTHGFGCPRSVCGCFDPVEETGHARRTARQHPLLSPETHGPAPQAATCRRRTDRAGWRTAHQPRVSRSQTGGPGRRAHCYVNCDPDRPTTRHHGSGYRTFGRIFAEIDLPGQLRMLRPTPGARRLLAWPVGFVVQQLANAGLVMLINPSLLMARVPGTPVVRADVDQRV